MDQATFINLYIENLKNKVNDLTHNNLILETKIQILEKTNVDLLKQLEKKEKKEKKTPSDDGFA